VTNDIPGPAPGDGVEDEQAREEAEFVQERIEPPALVEARHLHAIDVISIRRTFMKGVRHVCYVLPLLGLAMLVVWVIHVLAPSGYRWLAPEEVSHLQTLLFSGAISALATAIATKTV
jgi:hypothetical protein